MWLLTDLFRDLPDVGDRESAYEMLTVRVAAHGTEVAEQRAADAKAKEESSAAKSAEAKSSGGPRNQWSKRSSRHNPSSPSRAKPAGKSATRSCDRYLEQGVVRPSVSAFAVIVSPA
jgi:hypothetical protein